MSQHIFQFESEFQNSSQEAAPSSPSLSPTVSEKLERYGSSALSGVEHLTLIVGKDDLPLAESQRRRLKDVVEYQKNGQTFLR